MKDQIIQFAKEHEEEAIQLLKEIGKIPSPSHHEEKRAAYLKQWFIKNGFEQCMIDDMNNVIVEIPCPQNPDIVLFMAHIDVVFDDETELPMHQEGSILHAPGIGDDTANLVCMLMMAKWLLKNKDRLKMSVMIVCDACEEGLGNLDGCKNIMKNHGDRIKYFYSLDGNIGYCVNDAVGSHRYEITVHTQGGHSYSNFGNDNAIHIASKLICDLYNQPLPEEERTTFNAGKISGGSTINSIAQSVSLLYEYRSSNEACLQKMKEQLSAIIRKYTDEGKDIKIHLLGERPGSVMQGNADFDAWTEKNMRTVEQYYENPIQAKASSTDANIPLSKGVFANTIGTIYGKGAHTREEWMDLSSICTGIQVAVALLEQYMK